MKITKLFLLIALGLLAVSAPRTLADDDDNASIPAVKLKDEERAAFSGQGSVILCADTYLRDPNTLRKVHATQLHEVLMKKVSQLPPGRVILSGVTSFPIPQSDSEISMCVTATRE